MCKYVQKSLGGKEISIFRKWEGRLLWLKQRKMWDKVKVYNSSRESFHLQNCIFMGCCLIVEMLSYVD